MRRRELMVLIRSGKEQLYKETDYEIEIREVCVYHSMRWQINVSEYESPKQNLPLV